MKGKHQIERPEFLSVPEAARLCGVSRNTVFLWIRQGKLDAYRTPGRTNLIRPSDLVRFMNTSGMFVPPGLQDLAEKDERIGGPKPKARIKGQRTLLIVDDESANRRLIARGLGDRYNIEQAETGFEALHLMTQQRDIDVVLLDVRMPGQLGTETLQEMKRLRPDISVIIISGYTEEIPEHVRHDLAVHAILEKPFEMDDLERALENVCALLDGPSALDESADA